MTRTIEYYVVALIAGTVLTTDKALRLNVMLYVILCLLSVLLPSYCLSSESSAAMKKRYERIAKAGNVSIIYDESRDKSRQGICRIKYHWKRHFRYKYHTQESKVLLSITAQATIDPNLTHDVYMPRKGRGQQWHDRLLAHEYDHVCISLDPRPRMLLSHMAALFTVEKIEIASKEDITKSFISSQINRRLEEYENAIEHLIQENYYLLDHDDISSHGKKRIPNREKFFKGLYTRENLVKHDFKFIAEVETLLDTEEYKNVKAYYILDSKKSQQEDTNRPADAVD